ncbi:MAG: glycosyltransferase [Spirochaetes bacterium]|nr:glycosyltransferase [Spirochaetota bacterium]
MRSLDDYRTIVGDHVLYNVYHKAQRLYGKHILHLNSTYQGGGVAEILATLVPLMNDIGIDTGWRILHGNPDFFTITKKFHNALQGQSLNLTKIKKALYTATNENFSVYTHIDHDCVIIHDPQPLPLIKYHKKRQPWVWRCHIDLSNPSSEIWEFLKGFILRYDMVIISNEKYRSEQLPVEQRIIPPAIDPLSPKNMVLSEKDIDKYMQKFGIPRDKPIITQVSRFDKWKDPLGVLEVYKRVKKQVDCRLVLCGSMATDDPEGLLIYEKVLQKANDLVDSKDVILTTVENNILVNVLQRASSVIIQKSTREGFGLTVTEALWKSKPVVASNVGGIPLQIEDGKSGYLLEPRDIGGFADKILYLLDNPEHSKKIGDRGREMVRKNFLITRQVCNYVELLNDIL